MRQSNPIIDTLRRSSYGNGFAPVSIFCQKIVVNDPDVVTKSLSQFLEGFACCRILKLPKNPKIFSTLFEKKSEARFLEFDCCE